MLTAILVATTSKRISRIVVRIAAAILLGFAALAWLAGSTHAEHTPTIAAISALILLRATAQH